MEFGGPDREAVGVRWNDLLGRLLDDIVGEAISVGPERTTGTDLAFWIVLPFLMRTTDDAVGDRDRLCFVEPDELYNLKEDPRETENVIDEHHEEAQRLSSMFGDYFRRAPSTIVKGIQGRYEMASGSVN